MASTLQMMQMASQLGSMQEQAQEALGGAQEALGGARSTSAGPWDTVKNSFGVLCGGEIWDEVEQEAEVNAGNAPQDLHVKLCLRMCVYSAELATEELAYVVTCFGDGSAEERRLSSEVQAVATKLPVFRWNFEEWVTFFGFPRNFEFFVFGKRTLGSDAMLGRGSMLLSPFPTDGPQRKVIPLRSQASMLPTCQGEPKQTLVVVWQLVEFVTFTPPLSVVAEMGPTATDKAEWFVDVKALGVGLRNGPARDIRIEVSLTKPGGAEPLVWNASSVRRIDREGEGFAATWPEGWRFPTMRLAVSRAALLGHLLHVSLSQVSDGVARRLCSWRESVSDLFTVLDSRGQVLRFDAELTSRGDDSLGSARLEVDIYSKGMPPHIVPPSQAATDLKRCVSRSATTISMKGASYMQAISAVQTKAVPVRRGMPREALWQNRVVYRCAVYADGLLFQGDRCDPFVKVTLGNQVEQSDVIQCVSNHVEWAEPIKITAHVVDRVAIVQVYNDASQEMLCRAAITDVRQGAEYWLHCYGGALHAPKQVEALQMLRGLEKPASTYHGTVVIHFGQHQRVPRSYFDRLRAKRDLCVLRVRMHYGCYFKSLAGRQVSVLVQLAGCRLPDYRAAKELSRGDGSEPDPRHYNQNLLSFPGTVDAAGMLHFAPGNAYSERKTPEEFPLAVPPNALHAYFYIVVKGEESHPPKIFGLLRIQPRMELTNWSTMLYDTSVVDLPDAAVPTKIAGALLCVAKLDLVQQAADLAVAELVSARAISAEMCSEEMLPAEHGTWCCGSPVPSKLGSPGWEVPPPASGRGPRQTVYLHIDILAARNLPMAADIHNVSYSVQVQGKTVTPADGVGPSLHPSFMGRLVIPVEIDGVEGAKLPPVLVTITDNGLGGKRARTIAVVLVENIPTISKNADEVVDLGALHKAVWYALDAPQQSDFSFSKHGGVDPLWSPRPRLLMAAAYCKAHRIRDTVTPSGKDALENGYTVELVALRYEKFLVAVDLVGLRNLRENLYFPGLTLNSFWSIDKTNTEAIAVSDSSANPNFGPGHTPGAWQKFAQRVNSAISIVDDLGVSETHGKSGDSGYLPAEEDDAGSKPVFHLSKLVGERIKAPLYHTPIIRYLQEGCRNDVAKPFMLMPTMTFTVQNSFSGHSYGSVTVALDEVMSQGGGPEHPDWTQIIADEMAALPPELQGVPTLPGFVAPDDAYEVFLDVFAAEAGYVTLDSDVRIGRLLKDNFLFTVAKKSNLTSAPGEKPSPGSADQSFVQFFNPYDCLHGHASLMHEPPDGRCMPSLKCFNRAQPEGKCPKGPGELFAAVTHLRKLRPTSRLSFEELQQLSTSELIHELGAVGMRCMSHLTAPEVEYGGKDLAHVLTSSALTAVRPAAQVGLRCHEHTFIRPVGHVIDPTDRDSRFLARLRLGPPPDADAQEQHLAGLDQKTRNFLFVKFKFSGVVVWAAPEHVDTFTRPGAPLVAVKLSDGSGDVVVVKLPSFDLRYPVEQFWYPVKSFRERYATARKCAAIGKLAGHTSAAERSGMPAPIAKDAAEVHELGLRLDAETLREMYTDDVSREQSNRTKDNGYTRPLWVEENGFVLRLKKGLGTKSYDRCSTLDWYRTVLEQSFPEIRGLKKLRGLEDRDQVKAYAMAHLLNLRVPIDLPDDDAFAPTRAQCCLKAHVSCVKILDMDASGGQGQQSIAGPTPTEQRGLLPVERLWKKTNLKVTLSVLTAHGLRALVPGMFRVVGKLGTEEHSAEHAKPVTCLHASADLYFQLQFEADMPGPASLTIELWHTPDSGSATFIGSACMDVEDRWLVLQQRKLRENSQQDHLKQMISPSAAFTCHAKQAGPLPPQGPRKRRTLWKEPSLPIPLQHGDVDGEDLRPCCPAPESMPVELLPLHDEDSGSVASVCSLRLFADIGTSTEEPLKQGAHLQSAGADFEVRVRVHKVTNVCVFRDDAGRNDLYVRGEYRCRDMMNRSSDKVVRTDCHKYSTDTACFNWLWVFKARAPVVNCSLRLTLMDFDTISSDDQVYYPEHFSLDRLVLLAYHEQMKGNPPLGKISETILFTEWKGKYDPVRATTHYLSKLLPCWFRRRQLPYERYAELTIDVEVLPQEDADANPLEGNVRFSELNLNRFTWKNAATRPKATLVLLVGPTTTKRILLISRFFLPILCCIIISLLVVLLVFYTLSIIADFS